MNFIQDIKEPYNNKELILLISHIDGISKESAAQILRDKYKLTHGYCEILAAYYHLKYNIEIVWIRGAHYCLYYKGKYYDGFNTEGVSNIEDLEFCRTNQWLKTKNIHDLLVRDANIQNELIEKYNYLIK